MADERSKLIKIDAEPKEVYDTLMGKSVFGDRVFSKFQMAGDSGFGLIVNEKYGDFWRVNSSVAVIILIVGEKDSSEIFITTAGGAYGPARLDLGIHRKLLNEAEETLLRIFPKQ